MKLKTVALLASALIGSSLAMADDKPQQNCSAGSCSKKVKQEAKQASCAKKEASCSKKEASCAKKEASCSKKEASCAKKEAQ